ncbi:hypothetical protein A2477_00225 [Candidatus Falkowbacteria bacterium RIFOXYC2_FULL_47_12]|uniref:GxxExxY protein n=2 Tax=Candidatus Falkowiibacteriota TaxID=1752728 RepID=A0A1F5TQA2_9BACT|nr:MAG: hypothetical protein A2242_04060 [Candidatus Falkowbacteria bacterium RIFOXYA2_FULL_47_9]OGF41100.1 MAG: hypothetical protein A2477_00225 [Candidatus Falkowbacteria bacterium RIFOXYC2_FULL_47_12]
MYDESAVRKNILFPELSYEIIGCLFEVYNELGGGYQEKIYQKATARCLATQAIRYVEQVPYRVRFRGKAIGMYFMDFVIEDRVVLEIKRGNYFVKNNIKQVENYLKVTNLQLGILANFTNRNVKYIRILNIH